MSLKKPANTAFLFTQNYWKLETVPKGTSFQVWSETIGTYVFSSQVRWYSFHSLIREPLSWFSNGNQYVPEALDYFLMLRRYQANSKTWTVTSVLPHYGYNFKLQGSRKERMKSQHSCLGKQFCESAQRSNLVYKFRISQIIFQNINCWAWAENYYYQE